MLEIIKNDLYRLSDKKNKKKNLLYYRLKTMPSFRYLVTFRLCKHYQNRKKLFRILNLFLYKILQHQGIKYAMNIPLSMDIGPGLRIDHFGGIWLSPYTKVGKNCSISCNVVFGFIPRGINKGVPISIGDNVYIGPGAKILGKVTIGNNVVIGANSVVTKSIPDNVTAFGIPARIIAKEGSEDYINNKV